MVSIEEWYNYWLVFTQYVMYTSQFTVIGCLATKEIIYLGGSVSRESRLVGRDDNGLQTSCSMYKMWSAFNHAPLVRYHLVMQCCVQYLLTHQISVWWSLQ